MRLEQGYAFRWGWIAYETGLFDAEGDAIIEEKFIPLPPGGEQEVREMLVTNARGALPTGARFELRRQIPGNYGREKGMAWYRHPDMDAIESWEYGEGWTHDAAHGCFRMARLLA